MFFSKYIIKKLYPECFPSVFSINTIGGGIIAIDLTQLLNVNKYHYLKNKYNYDLTNNFDEFLNIFSKLQKIHNAFNKLAKIFLFKRAKQYNEYDLVLDEIPDYESEKKFYITLKEHGIKYTFLLSELNNIIFNSLTYHDDYFIESHEIKNPYTNLTFSKENLYNIYFKLLQRNITPHELFVKYINCNLHLTSFIINHQVEIRDYIIYKEAYNMNKNDAIEHIENMLNDYLNIVLCYGFNKEKLIYFYKYLYNYLYGLYGMNEYKKRVINRSLKSQLRLFKMANVNFGRKIYHINPIIGPRSKIIDTINGYESI